MKRTRQCELAEPLELKMSWKNHGRVRVPKDRGHRRAPQKKKVFALQLRFFNTAFQSILNEEDVQIKGSWFLLQMHEERWQPGCVFISLIAPVLMPVEAFMPS